MSMRTERQLPPEIQQLEEASAAANRLAEHGRSLEAEHATLQRERKTIAAPVPVDDIVANMRAMIDARAAQYAADHAGRMIDELGGYLEFLPLHRAARRGSDYRTVKPTMWQPHPPGERLLFEDLIGLFPELMKQRLEAIIRSKAYQPGPPLADRIALLRNVDERIADVERRHTAFVEAVGALNPPISIALLPSVHRRRAAEAERERRDRDATAAQRAAEHLVDAQAAAAPARPTVGA
jgi:hypothetical protein